MGIDWFVLLAPVLLVLLLVPFVFVGCGLDATGTRLNPDGFLSYGAAIVASADPAAVDPRPIFGITALWSAEMQYTILSQNIFVKPLPPQTISSPGVPLPAPLGDGGFVLQAVPSSTNVDIRTIRCACVVVLDAAGTSMTTPVASQPFFQGKTHVFRLVRGITPPGGPAPAAFTVVPDTVGN